MIFLMIYVSPKILHTGIKSVFDMFFVFKFKEMINMSKKENIYKLL